MATDISLSGSSPGQLQNARDRMYARGGTNRPAPPVNIIAQPGASKVVLTWSLPTGQQPIYAIRIYLDTESHRIMELPAGVTTAQIPLQTGQTRGIFLSCVTAAGAESRKVQVICASLGAAAPDPPPVPPTGGGVGRRECFSGGTLIETRSGARAIQDISVGDQVLTASGKFLPVAQRHIHEGFSGVLRDVCTGLVTENHLILDRGVWRPAGEVFPDKEKFSGTLYNLTIATDEPLSKALAPETERSFVLAVNGIKAHNLKMING